MSSIASTKTALRQDLRAARRQLPDAARAEATQQLALHITRLPGWQSFQGIALYLATDGEIDTSAISELVLAAGKRLYLPVVAEGGTLEFARWGGTTKGTQLNRYGIREPDTHSPRIATEALDCICLPLVGWSTDGSRLGMGGGYYDRTLANATGPIKTGLGFELQRQETLPRESWDVRLDFVATETNLYSCKEQ
ncbi:5-formyltetrahydrofolate cyclo-ligase [Halioglobus maricola]|uniref:5-formyltetrahydrofolate cyclo-ligase n=1 Tax=Halioglobus maricola TaxID=2601894 RepID=A0A5P9NQD9_9GAMM|nr:5-formyltetrahydrofolate cyclo-ligase [Halioglobus maricola]QFU77504.1 5-formyltetrahydrofolate cyclo-ligase [Halioglobus maricola]